MRAAPLFRPRFQNIWKLDVQPHGLFAQDGIVSVAEVREIYISDVNSRITSAVADIPVDGTTEEKSGQYAPLTDTVCCEETVR